MTLHSNTYPGRKAQLLNPFECELDDEMLCCPWEESDPDPDELRDDRDERRRLEKEFPDDED